MKKVFFLVFLPFLVLANVDERKVDIYYANGISTTPSQAQHNTFVVLQSALLLNNYSGNEENMFKKIGKVTYSYNSTYSLPLDLLESFSQIMNETFNDTPLFRNALRDLIDGIAAITKNADLQDQVEAYEASINAGHKVLVVAHLQGNLFTHEAYNRLGDDTATEWMQDYFEAISIASPAYYDIEENTPRIDWDNDLVARIANFGESDGSDIIGNVRRVTWEMKPYSLDENNTAIVKPKDNYVYASEVNQLYNERWKAIQKPLDYFDTNVHGFTFYMGEAIKDSETERVFINPFTESSITDTTARTQILQAIENKIALLQNTPSQWNLINKNQSTSICDERRAELVHFRGAIAPIPAMGQTFPFNTNTITIDGEERNTGKVYQIGTNDTDPYVMASTGGTEILDIENGTDNRCYELQGTGEKIVIENPCADLSATDGVITVDLQWKNPEIDMELSVTKDNANVGTMDIKDVDCPREHFYISETEVEAGRYYVSITHNTASAVDETLFPETISVDINSPDKGLKFAIDIPRETLLNIGDIAYIDVTEKSAGEVSLSVKVAEQIITSPGYSYTAKTYKTSSNGTTYNYETFSLLNNVTLGPLNNALLSVTSLTGHNFGETLYTGYTSEGDSIETSGLMVLPYSLKESVQDDALYLITASEGVDVDADDDLSFDATPTQNLGTIHAIVSGRSIKANGLRLNVLTELGYQVAKEKLQNAITVSEAIDVLDHTAEVLLKDDINGDGSINHLDLHAWVPSFDKDALNVSYDNQIHPIVLKIYDNLDIYDDAYDLIYPAYAPVAIAGDDQQMTEPGTITLDGSASYDLNGEIIEYTWNTNGTILCQGSDPLCVITNMSIDDRNFTLTVTDNNGNINHDTLQVLYPYKPIADAGPVQTVEYGQDIILDASSSYDDDGYIVQYHWSDKKTSQTLCNSSNPICIIEGKNPGIYAYKLTVYDNYNTSSSSNVTVNVIGERLYNIDIIAGNGNSGYSGDGGPAVHAQLNNPGSIAVDGLDNIYFSDKRNNVIRKIDTNGLITTFAGTGVWGSSSEVFRTDAQLSWIDGLAIGHDGIIYFTEKYYGNIRKIDSNNFVTPIVSTFNTAYMGLDIDMAGNIYVVDERHSVIQKVTPDGQIIHIAGQINGSYGYAGNNGPAVDATLWAPTDVKIGPDGNLIIADGNCKIRKVDSKGIITAFAGNANLCGYSGDGGKATDAFVRWIRSMDFDNEGNLYFIDYKNIRKIDTNGIITTITGEGHTNFPAGSFSPQGIAVDSNGNIYVTDPPNNRILKIY
jgi:sugar lactone lactonase YvrE